jgi:hypothetical protein
MLSRAGDYVLIGFYGFDDDLHRRSPECPGRIVAHLPSHAGSLLRQLNPMRNKKSGLAIFRGAKNILLSSFLVGFIGLGFEMLWIRILLIVNKNTAYAFPSILFVFLFGLALGGYLGDAKQILVQPGRCFVKSNFRRGGGCLHVSCLRALAQSDVPWIKNFLKLKTPSSRLSKSSMNSFSPGDSCWRIFGIIFCRF